MDIAILVLCVDFEDHECNREEACVQEKEEQKRDQFLDCHADHPDQESEVIAQSHE